MAQNLSNLPVGAKVMFGKYSVNGEPAQPIEWIIVAKNHKCAPGYPDNSVTLLTNQLINRMAYDAKEPSATHYLRNEYGNNRYSLSNIDQWLNSAVMRVGAGTWYSPTHSADAPPMEGYVTANPYYNNNAGFLNAFTTDERNAILDTTIGVRIADVDSRGSYWENITRKVFLPSAAEVDLDDVASSAEGSRWSHFSGYSTMCSLTTQARDNLPANALPNPPESPIYWWTRTPVWDSGYYVQCVDQSGDSNPYTRANEIAGVRPALNLSGSQSVSDTTDSQGRYTLTWNIAPPAPTNLNVPTPLVKGSSATISWSPVVDPDGDFVQYIVDTYDGNEWSNSIVLTSETSVSLVVSSDVFQVRVRAIDNRGGVSDYTTSLEYDVVTNKAPTLNVTWLNNSVQSRGFSVQYSMFDLDGDSVTIDEYINDELIYSRVLTSFTTIMTTYYLVVSDVAFAKLKNGQHSFTIRATDARGATTEHTGTFVKQVTKLEVQTAPMASETMPTRIALSVSKNIPADAIFKVEVCNNANDATPTWEDATSSVIGAMVHVFENTAKTAVQWAVCIRVTVDRNGADGACYISRIGGNFE